MAPKSYDALYRKFTKHLESCENRYDPATVRKISEQFSTNLRPSYDLYARKYHAFLFTRWCDTNKIEYPADWNPEGFWPGNFR